jgi:hypothetical protein
MTSKAVKTVRIHGRSEKIHYAVECTPSGEFSYILCRGFPSVGKHQRVEGEPSCAQCKKIAQKMFRRNNQFYLKQ